MWFSSLDNTLYEKILYSAVFVRYLSVEFSIVEYSSYSHLFFKISKGNLRKHKGHVIPIVSINFKSIPLLNPEM